jgi:hypothetical protein
MSLRGLAQLLEGSTASPEVEALVTEMMPVLSRGLPRPIIRMVEKLGVKWLGECRYKVGDATTTISVQRFVAGDEPTLRRVIAHELCHHEDLLAGWDEAAAKGWSTETFLMDRKIESKGHGPEWQAIAAEFNHRYGAGFVTPKSDESYAKQSATRDALLLLWQNGARLMWAVSVRPSARQRAYIEKKLGGIDGPSMRLVATRDVDLIQGGPRPGDGFAYSHDVRVNEKLLRAWEDGKRVDLADV